MAEKATANSCSVERIITMEIVSIVYILYEQEFHRKSCLEII